MRQRWEWLAGTSLVSLIGIAGMWMKFGGPASAWASIEVIGMILCTLVGLAAAARSHARKWPAAVALVCAAPMAQNILLDFPITMELVIHLGMTYVLFLGGAVGAVAVAVAILVMRPPVAPTDEVVARARAVR